MERRVSDERKRSAALARALAASTSRWRGGALVTRESSSSRAAVATRSTARSKASWFTLEGRVKPLSLRTNCSDDALISSSVAGGLKLWSVLIFRHMGDPRLIPGRYTFGALVSKVLLLARNTTAARRSRRWPPEERLVRDRSGPRCLPHRRHSREQGDRHAEQNTCIRGTTVSGGLPQEFSSPSPSITPRNCE